MKEKKENKTAKAAEKVTIKADTAIAAYNILTSAKSQDGAGIHLGVLDTADLFRVIRAINALKPVATAFEDFRKDAQERLKPDGWDDVATEYDTATEERKNEIDRMFGDYSAKVNECISTELTKDKELDSWERIDEEAFGKLIKGNSWLDTVPVLTLHTVLC